MPVRMDWKGQWVLGGELFTSSLQRTAAGEQQPFARDRLGVHSLMDAKIRGYAQEAYLRRASEFLIACRRKDPLGGMWDVADVQWWWRDGGYDDPARQLFLEGPDGAVHGMILESERYQTFDYEILPGLEDTPGAARLFGEGLDWLSELLEAESDVSSVSFFIRDRHAALRRLAEQRGFVEARESYVQTALALQGSPLDFPIPFGHRVRPLAQHDLVNGGPPVLRTTPQQFARVRQAPLYRQEQQLVAVDPADRPVAECIYWVDPVNMIGVVEPIETRPEYRRQGFGKALLSEGLTRMSAAGVRLAKVSHYRSNEAAAALYRSLGFQRQFERIRYESAAPRSLEPRPGETRPDEIGQLHGRRSPPRNLNSR